ncbi:hypothetical protein ACWT_3575 [Actinoplanes sp. SE50]|nr:hypothetical protein ACPL_3703 [Actinoplanes sp. SE50/110]ATO82990.1 hypothetical protein ACWT_3575 [Actinoplanes sp. SE50]SLM00398.1 hypothetical protein ACSP50_3630 [Actinoplanes sp. SE50/110]
MRVTLTRSEIANGDESRPTTTWMPDDLAVARAVALRPDLHHGYTWVAYADGGRPLAVTRDGRWWLVGHPESTLGELGVTEIRYDPYDQDPDEAVRVLRAGGRAGRRGGRLLVQPRDTMQSRVWELLPRQVATPLMVRLGDDGMRLRKALRLTAYLHDPILETDIRNWFACRREPLWQLADFCSRLLEAHGYLDRQRALEFRVAGRLPAPRGGWQADPPVLGPDFTAVPITDPTARHALDHLARYL